MSITLNRQSLASLDAEERDADRRAARLAATYGPCATCKVDVGADGIHAWRCTAVPTERRANRGWASCDYPVTLVAHVADVCGARAVIETGDLGDIKHLCAKHHAEAQRWNTYRADPL